MYNEHETTLKGGSQSEPSGYVVSTQWNGNAVRGGRRETRGGRERDHIYQTRGAHFLALETQVCLAESRDRTACSVRILHSTVISTALCMPRNESSRARQQGSFREYCQIDTRQQDNQYMRGACCAHGHVRANSLVLQLTSRQFSQAS